MLAKLLNNIKKEEETEKKNGKKIRFCKKVGDFYQIVEQRRKMVKSERH